MYKKPIVALTFVLGGFVAGSVQAANNYFGGGYAALDYSQSGVDADLSLGALYGRLGTSFNENFSGEVRLGIGMTDDSFGVMGTDINVELDNIFGGYLRGGFQAGENFYPYAVLGYTRGKLTASASGFGSESDSESDVSFGIGTDIGLGENLDLNIEYMNYLDKDGAEISGFSIGIVKPF